MRSVCFMLLCGAILIIPGTVGVVLFSTTPSYLTYDSWRLIRPGSGAEWRVCYLEFLDAGNDYKPVSLKGARVVSSPPVPANFDIGSKDCESFWSSGNTTDAYIGIILPQAMDIRLIKMGQVPSEVKSCRNTLFCYTGCDSPSSCADCCLKDMVSFLPDEVSVQRLGSSEWIDTYTDQDTNGGLMSLDTYQGMPPENNMRWVDFGFGIGGLMFGAILLLAAPIQYCVVRKLKRNLLSTREELARGTALVLTYGDTQWRAFVEAEYGPGGRAEKSNSFLMSCFGFVVVSFFGVSTLYLGSHKRHLEDSLSFTMCLEIGIPLAFVLTIGAWPIQMCLLKRNYRNQLNRPQKAILASATLSCEWSKELIFKGDFTKKILGASVLEGNAAEGALLKVSYSQKSGKHKVVKAMHIPLPPDRAQEVKAFITSNANVGFYNPSVSLRSEILHAAKAAKPLAKEVGKLLLHSMGH